MTAFKAQAMARDLQERLQAILAGAAFSTAYDASFNPTLKIVHSSETIFINIAAAGNAGRVNSVGSSQPSYSPHIATVLQDSTPVDLNTRYACLDAAAWLGARLDVYEVHPLPASYDLTGATLVSSIYPDPYNKLTNQM